jgi:hypothetical protein
MTHYAITVEGHLDCNWSDWLDGFAVVHLEDGIHCSLAR